MRVLIAYLMITPLSACTTQQLMSSSPSQAVAEQSLVGVWRYEDQVKNLAAVDRDRCGTDFGGRYDADGSYSGYDEAGEWRIDGGVLSEIIWEPETASGLTPRLSTPDVRRWRMEWLSPDVINLYGLDEAGLEPGEASALVRCPDAE